MPTHTLPILTDCGQAGLWSTSSIEHSQGAQNQQCVDSVTVQACLAIYSNLIYLFFIHSISFENEIWERTLLKQYLFLVQSFLAREPIISYCQHQGYRRVAIYKLHFCKLCILAPDQIEYYKIKNQSLS